MNKKAEALHTGFMTLYVLGFGAILLVMAFTLYSTTDNYISGFLAHDPMLENRIYAYRAINDCLSYHDEITGRSYPGVIDYSLYDQDHVQSCFERGSFSLQLRDIEQSTDYDRLLVGFGAARNIKHYPVLIKYQDSTVKRGELLFGTG